MLENIFVPVFEATVNPQAHKELSVFLRHVSVTPWCCQGLVSPGCSCLCTRNGTSALTQKISSVGLWLFCHFLGRGCESTSAEREGQSPWAAVGL